MLLVERGVARFAQELLLAKGIALVLNVKLSTLDRLARCTGGQVQSSLASNATGRAIRLCDFRALQTLLVLLLRVEPQGCCKQLHWLPQAGRRTDALILDARSWRNLWTASQVTALVSARSSPWRACHRPHRSAHQLQLARPASLLYQS